MRKLLLLSIFSFAVFKSFSQTPFTTLVKEPRFLKRAVNGSKLKAAKNEDKSTVKSYLTTNDSTFTNNNADSIVERSVKNDFDFFKNNALSYNFMNKGENRASINAQVLYYKLYVANPNDQNTYRLNRYNIPLMLISKLSTNYDSVSASTAIDVLDYEAAPVTIRVMPSFKKAFETYSDVFYIGFYTDLRGINLSKPTEGTNELEFVGSGGIGFTYQADGKAGTYNTNGEYEEGRYSLSLMFQAAIGNKEVISKLFSTTNNYVTSIQGYFLVKVSDKSKLNIKGGYQHFFQPTMGGIKNNISIALGM